MRWTALALAVALCAGATPALAQSNDALANARRLFTEALGDQEAKHYEVALEKFRRVAAVKDTANVRYRIASCLEALGQRAEALTSYNAAIHLGAQDPAGADAVQASRARAVQLDPVVARLSIVMPSDAPNGTEVRVDDAAVDGGSLGNPVLLDPGHHTLRATAPGRAPFETAVTLATGASVSITVTLQPTATPPGPLPPPAPVEGTASTTPVGAWVALGIGGALAVGSVVSFVLRESNMATLNRDCQASGGALQCPSSSTDEVNGAHDAAKVEGPLGFGLAAGAVVSLGIGAWLFASAPSSGSSALTVTPAWNATGGGLLVRGSL